MPRLVGHRPSASQRRRVLRELLGQPVPAFAPGVFDGLSALIAEEAGFPVVYVSGGAVSRSCGLPDLGLLSFTEMRDRIREVVDSVSCPVIADADTGYGGVLNVVRTVQDLEQLGVAALHLEDQETPKRCGHYEHKSLVGVSDMQAKVAAALAARTDPDFLIIARTDGIAVEGIDAAIARARAYAEAGADLIFVEAPTSVAEIETISRALPYPLVLNMFAGGKTPHLSSEEIARIGGYRIVLVPSDLQRAGLHAMRRAAQMLRHQGSTKLMASEMLTFSERDALVSLPEYSAAEESLLNVTTNQ